MPAGTFNFEEKYRIEQGVYRVQEFIWKDSLGSPINLTGYSARMQMRKSQSSPEILIDLSTTNGGIVITPASGSIVIVIKESDTSGVTWKQGVYDIELTNSAGKVTRFLEGSFELSKEVTRT